MTLYQNLDEDGWKSVVLTAFSDDFIMFSIVASGLINQPYRMMGSKKNKKDDVCTCNSFEVCIVLTHFRVLESDFVDILRAVRLFADCSSISGKSSL